MVGAWLLTIFQLGLSDGGAQGDIPQRGILGLISLTELDVAKKGEL